MKKDDKNRNLAVEKMRELDPKLNSNMVVLLLDQYPDDEATAISEIYIGRTSNTLIVAKVFKKGNINVTTVFTHDPNVSLLKRDCEFLKFAELSEKIKRNFSVDPEKFRIIPYLYQTSWKTYAARYGDKCLILFDLATGSVQVTV